MSSHRGVCFILSILLLSSLFLVSCAETTGSGAPVSIPRVFIDCTTGACNSNTVPNPRITVMFTTSGCDLPDFGSAIAGTSEAITCTATSGCYGEITSWVDSDGDVATTVPSGTYSLCARIDYNRDYPATTSGDTRGVLDNVSVGSVTSTQFIRLWTQL